MRFSPHHTPISLLLALALALCACGKSGGTDPVLPGAGDPGDPGDGATEAPTELVYGQRVFVLDIDEPILPQTPTFTGIVSAWSIAPALPSGFQFNSTDGSISGAPTTYTPRSNHRVLASNSLGSIEAQLIIQAGGEARFVFSASTTDGSLAALEVRANGSDAVPHTWSAGSASGLQDSSQSYDGKVICAVNDDQLILWQVDAITGFLTRSDTVELGTDNHSLAVHPTGEYVMVATRNAQLVRSYRINSQSSTLSLVSELAAGSQTEQIEMDPLGRYVIVRNAFDASSTSTPTRSYSIAQDTGALALSATFSLLTVNVKDMVLGVLGEALYLTIDLPLESVLHCRVDTSTGKPSLVGLTAVGAAPFHLSPAPDGKRLYVSNQLSDTVSLLNINPSSGDLNHDGSLQVSDGISGLSFSFDGNELYLVNTITQELIIKTLNPSNGQFDGSINTPLRPGAMAPLQSAGEASVSTKLSDIFALNQQSGNITAYSVDGSTGQLMVNGAPVEIGGTIPSDIAVDPSGKFLFACSQLPNTLETYALQPDGSLVNLLLTTNMFGAVPELMCVDPSGSFVYIVDSNFGLLLSYTVQSNGKLMASGSSPLVGNPTSITTAPEGDFVYVTMEGDGSALSGEIRRFSINVLDGKLSVLAPQATPGGPSSLSFNSHGTRAYVTMFVDNTAHSYNVASDGSLVEIGTGTTTQPDPRHVALSRDGRFAYVAFEDGPGNGGILLYDIDSTSGEMSVPQWVDAEAAGINPSQTLISPSGAHAYVLARGSESILTFDVSPQDGRLTVSQIQSLGLGPNRIAPSLILE